MKRVGKSLEALGFIVFMKKFINMQLIKGSFPGYVRAGPRPVSGPRTWPRLSDTEPGTALLRTGLGIC